ncbi:MAG: formate dehydrogenase accessory sulfurtransferase FdhD [Hydrogenibacillus schlegelii]|uniref:Sulfur carrier protein FdhD n=1 Tax=Hydrogenibacillus schlegelii TaxID=1484 RepID=A0A947CX71_HYDSH|nr:formate dehydrogenase accessory sulfurtransferase FdhD [Hydrogenibacillus schlegelii]
MEPLARRNVLKLRGDRAEWIEDVVAAEMPLTVMVGGEELATILCSPIDLEDLVLGFLASEGLVRTMKDVRSISIDEARGVSYVELAHPPALDFRALHRRTYGSCCGRGRAQFYFQSDLKTAKYAVSEVVLTADDVQAIMRVFRQRSMLFKQTGGVHNAALVTKEGILLMRSDIGRHNALDKLYGAWLKQPFALSDKAIAFSGRLSSEVVLKVAKIGVGLIISKSAPTALGLSLAEALNITVVGFARGEEMNVYTHPERIVLPERPSTGRSSQLEIERQR